MTAPLKTRFAPSPTGYLHLGHVVSALHARHTARPDGTFLIRIEDIDGTRCTPHFTQALHEDLTWLGLSSDGPILQQSHHLPDYAKTLNTLRERRLLYPCFCTRAEIAAAATPGHSAPDGSIPYPGTCRDTRTAPNHRIPAWRLHMDRALNTLQHAPGWYETGKGYIPSRAAEFGDIILARRDTGVSYHLCVTHDDARQNISHVTRGMDLYHTTSIHRVLQELMNWPEPHYHHHPLIMAENGQKLSKRDGAEGIRVLRSQGATPRQILEHPLVLKTLAR